MTINGMHGSEVLKNEIFKGQPTPSELQLKIDAMLSYLSPSVGQSPEVQSAVKRIEGLMGSIESLAGDTRRELVRLHADTIVSTGMSSYSQSVEALTSRQSGYIESILSGENAALLQAHQLGRVARPSASIHTA